MRTREEILKIINSDNINESEFTESELELIDGDDFKSPSDLVKFMNKYRSFYNKQIDYCEKILKEIWIYDVQIKLQNLFFISKRNAKI
jgi:hypothetical protein